MPHIQVFSEVPARDGELDALRQRLADVAFPAPFALVLTESRLELRKLDEPKLGAVYVDFVEGAVAHRRKFGGGRGQSIATSLPDDDSVRKAVRRSGPPKQMLVVM